MQLLIIYLVREVLRFRTSILECIDQNLTSYEANRNLKRFIFATPFTLDGKSHGSLERQYNKKTIVTIEHFFPFIKTRIKVVKEASREIILTPIEVATEDIEAKLQNLMSAIQEESLVLLSMQVQSCVATAVMAGPCEVAKIFLRFFIFYFFTDERSRYFASPEKENVYPAHQRQKLKSLFGSLLFQTSQGLAKLKEVARSNKDEKMREQYRFLSDR